MKILRTVIFSDVSPRLLWRLAQRVQNEVPGVAVCGLIYSSQSVSRCKKGFADSFRTIRSNFGDLLLRWAHASPTNPNVGSEFDEQTLTDLSHRAGWSATCIDDVNSDPAQALMQELQPDLCVALISVLPTALLRMPRQGSVIAIRPRPGGEIGAEIQIRTFRLQATGDENNIRVVSLPIEPFDTATSIALKADMVGSDLLMQGAASIAQNEGLGTNHAHHYSQILSYLQYFQRRKLDNLSSSRPMLDMRPVWRLFLSSLLLSPFMVTRNWYRRWRCRFPVIILVYHLISDVPHPLGMPTEMFLHMVEYLQKHYRIVSLSEAVELLKADAVEVPTVALSFDDGYLENFLTLRSVVEATGIPVSMFVCTGLTENQAELPHDQMKGYHNFNVLGWDQLTYLAKNGVEIGSHTRNHFDCGTSDRIALEQEIAGAKADLEYHLGQRIYFFGFPFGHPENISDAAMQLARSNYEYVLSCFGGQNFAHAARSEAHLLRKYVPPSIWALELSLQGILDLRRTLKHLLGWSAEGREIARVRSTTALENTV